MYKVKIGRIQQTTSQITYMPPSSCSTPTMPNRVTHRKMRWNEYRTLSFVFSMFAVLLVTIAITVAVVLIKYTPEVPPIINVKVPDGEFVIENAFHCALCAEKPYSYECYICSYDDVILEV